MVTVTIPKRTRHVNHYACIILPEHVMPATIDVKGYGSFPGKGFDLHRETEVELVPGQFLFVGRPLGYGYDLVLHAVDEGGTHYCFRGDGDLKTAMKAWADRGVDRKHDGDLRAEGFHARGTVRKNDMKGAGKYAAFVRVITAHRRGMSLAKVCRTWEAAERLPGFKAGIAAAKRHRENVARLAKAQARADALREEEAERAEEQAMLGALVI